MSNSPGAAFSPSLGKTKNRYDDDRWFERILNHYINKMFSYLTMIFCEKMGTYYIFNPDSESLWIEKEL
jgi:hypothetical protein